MADNKNSIFEFMDESPFGNWLEKKQYILPKNKLIENQNTFNNYSPDSSDASLNYNFIFRPTPTSNLTPTQFQAFINGFRQNIVNIWGSQRYNNMPVRITGQFINTLTTPIPPLQPNFTNLNVNVDNNTLVSYAQNGTIFMNERSFQPVTGVFPDNTPSHEFGHILGLSDRYVDGGIFISTWKMNQNSIPIRASNRVTQLPNVKPNINTDFGVAVEERGIGIPRNNERLIQGETMYYRETIPIWHPIDLADPDYDPYNNLFSTGNPLLTPHQICVAFGDYPPEPTWNMDYRWFAREVLGISRTPFCQNHQVYSQISGSCTPKFDAFNIIYKQTFPAALEYIKGILVTKATLRIPLGLNLPTPASSSSNNGHCKIMTETSYPLFALNGTLLKADGNIMKLKKGEWIDEQCGSIVQLVMRKNGVPETLSLTKAEEIVSTNLNIFTEKGGRGLAFSKKKPTKKEKSNYRKMADVMPENS